MFGIFLLAIFVLIAMPPAYGDVTTCILKDKIDSCRNAYCYYATCVNDKYTVWGCNGVAKRELEAELDSNCREFGSSLNSLKLCDCNNCNRQGAITCEIDGPGVKPPPQPPPPQPPPALPGDNNAGDGGDNAAGGKQPINYLCWLTTCCMLLFGLYLL